MSDHEAVVDKIKQALEEKGFQVQVRGNNLPIGSIRAEAIYRPDMLVRSKGNDDIAWIVEIETSEAGSKAYSSLTLNYRRSGYCPSCGSANGAQ
jgi:hypothetical protein